jgi:pyruvate/2-oxoacid:ferredoxin oxidoreductase alpha subunit
MITSMNVNIPHLKINQDPTPPYGMEPPDPPAAPMTLSDGPESIDGVEDDSAEAIQRIKDSMKEEVKKFETSDRVEYFNMH